MSDATDLISALKAMNAEDVNLIYVPSTGKKQKFTSLNVSQQKNIIKSALDGLTSGVTFSQALNQIVLDTAVDGGDKLLITDRYPIILGLRAACIGNYVDIVDSKGNTAGSTSLSHHISTLSVPLTAVEESSVVSKGGITVTLSIPTIKRDNKINELYLTNVANTARDVVGDMFVYELAKFIKSVAIGDTVVEFASSTADHIKIIESLPVSLNEKVIKYVNSIRTLESGWLTTHTGSIDLGPGFFNMD